MATLESRITKLESAAEPECAAFENFVRCLPPLDKNGDLNWRAIYPELDNVFGPWLTERGDKTYRYRDGLLDPIERGLADLLVTFNGSHDPFAYERYRGRVPDRVLAAIYASMRNYAFKPDVTLRVRTLAGLEANNGNS